MQSNAFTKNININRNRNKRKKLYYDSTLFLLIFIPV